MERNTHKGLTEQKFHSEDDCLFHFAKLKWPSFIDFECYACGHDKYCKGEKPYSRECLKCGYDESPTANTALHQSHYPLLTTFLVVEEIARQSVFDMFHYSTEWISSTITRSKTKTAIRRRIQSGLENNSVELTGYVDIEIFQLKEILPIYKGDEYLLLAVQLDGNDLYSYSKSTGAIANEISEETLHDFLRNHIAPDTTIDIYNSTSYAAIEDTHPDTMFFEKVRYAEGSYETLPYIKMQIQMWLSRFNYRVNIDSIRGGLNEFFFLWNSYIQCDDPFDNFPVLYDEIISELAKRKQAIKGQMTS